MRSLRRVLLFAGSGIVVGLAVGAQVFPVRWDDEVVTVGPPAVLGTISADAIRLVPMDSLPFDCDATRLGWMVVLNVPSDPFSDRGNALCICSEVHEPAEPAGIHLGYYWALTHSQQEDPTLELCEDP